MEAEPNRETTREPTLADLAHLARELNDRGARYVVIGGVAMNLLGHARATFDVDLLIAANGDNQKKVKGALATLPDQAILEAGDEDIASYIVLRVNDVITVDLMTAAGGIGYEEAEADIIWKEIEGVRIPVASARLMLRLKQTWREKDAEDRRVIQDLLKRAGN
jgi:predicted nucleotidyltransferase